MKTEKRIVQILLRSGLFHDFSAAELQEILPELHVELEFAEQGKVLIETDDPAQRVGLVVSGRAMLYRSGESSRAHELGYRAPDDVLGLTAMFSGPQRSPVTVKAVKDSEILWIDIRPLLLDERYRDRFKNAVMLILANHSVRNILRLDVLQSPTMRERIMTYFKSMQDKYGSDLFQIKPTQAEMADYLGVNRSALSRELNKMQREGILEILPNRRYHILKWKIDSPEFRQENVNIAQENSGNDKLR